MYLEHWHCEPQQFAYGQVLSGVHVHQKGYLQLCEEEKKPDYADDPHFCCDCQQDTDSDLSPWLLFLKYV